VYDRQNERDPEDRKHHERFEILEIMSPVRKEMVVRDEEIQTRPKE